MHPSTPDDRQLEMRTNSPDDFSWVSRSGRFHVQTGNFGTMIVDDRHDGQRHVVVGKIPEVMDTLSGKRQPATEDEMRAAFRTWRGR